jgi:hypothetical protein
MTPAELEALIARLRERPQTFRFTVGGVAIDRPTLEAEAADALERFQKMQPVAWVHERCLDIVANTGETSAILTRDAWTPKKVALYRSPIGEDGC